MHAGAIVKAGGRDIYVELYYDRDEHMWYGSCQEVGDVRGKTRQECIDWVKREARKAA